VKESVYQQKKEKHPHNWGFGDVEGIGRGGEKHDKVGNEKAPSYAMGAIIYCIGTQPGGLYKQISTCFKNRHNDLAQAGGNTGQEKKKECKTHHENL